ncbi:MAG: hypothetical protein JWM36_2854 [Hyphomicrobiales bacterium]|nr:hypothetical protein [Hyphomicrobiales bacterium]
MDMLLTPESDGKTWRLTDLLGRSMGTIVQKSPGDFVLEPEGKAQETMNALPFHGYKSLDDVLARIEKHTRGVCRRV